MMPTRMTSEIDQTFQRGKSSISRSPAWLTWRSTWLMRRLDHPDLDALGDFDLGLIVADLGHLAADAAAGDDLSPFLTAAIAA